VDAGFTIQGQERRRFPRDSGSSESTPRGKRSPALKQKKHFAFGAEKRLKQGGFK
jgi:hypothetical protein